MLFWIPKTSHLPSWSIWKVMTKINKLPDYSNRKWQYWEKNYAEKFELCNSNHDLHNSNLDLCNSSHELEFFSLCQKDLLVVQRFLFPTDGHYWEKCRSKCSERIKQKKKNVCIFSKTHTLSKIVTCRVSLSIGISDHSLFLSVFFIILIVNKNHVSISISGSLLI